MHAGRKAHRAPLRRPTGGPLQTAARAAAARRPDATENTGRVRRPDPVAEVRATIAEAQDRLALNGQRTVLLIDEIHRFNKAQQDALLPYVEDRTITLIGATTENLYLVEEFTL